MREFRSASWRLTNLSVSGATHVRHRIVCQDSSASGSLEDGWSYLVVADGHGSASYFRSDRGSAFAVEAMVKVFRTFRTFLHDQQGSDAWSSAADAWWDRSAKLVVESWRELVLDDLDADPPLVPGRPATEPGVERLFDDVREQHGYQGLMDLIDRWRAWLSTRLGHDAPGPSGVEVAEPSPTHTPVDDWQLKAYGTTALGVLISPDCLYWFQVGDGAIVKIVAGRPSYLVAPPEEAIANETPSLCSRDAAQKALVGAEPLRPGRAPTALVLTTDGVPNSYVEFEGFLEFCRDVAGHAMDDPDALAEKLARWLPQISNAGSGDDMSVALAWNDGPEIRAVEEPGGADPGAGEPETPDLPIGDDEPSLESKTALSPGAEPDPPTDLLDRPIAPDVEHRADRRTGNTIDEALNPADQSLAPWWEPGGSDPGVYTVPPPLLPTEAPARRTAPEWRKPEPARPEEEGH